MGTCIKVKAPLMVVQEVLCSASEPLPAASRWSDERLSSAAPAHAASPPAPPAAVSTPAEKSQRDTHCPSSY